MVTMKVLGLNCGTSIDDLRAQILRLCRPNQADAGTTLAEICDLNFALGRQFFRAVRESGVDLDQVDVIASHGQTLWHQPEGDHRSTLQMAEPAVIAHDTQKTVVSGFRVAELAAGRQGAPLAGFFEAGLLSHPEKTRISQNIGGIGNASVLPATNLKTSMPASTYVAFDTGPGNVLIDAAMRIISNGELHYDHDGTLGIEGEGSINSAIVDRYLDSEPYFQAPLPKTTGRELL
ncbi:hypothetical protein PLIIFM63780_010395 [Purpureocillium lilacinum]|nr:hypothetical protein PLIIFM63780_010395 [Purpureocillium lilacinum]